MKLYTTIATSKLATFADTPDSSMRAHILCLKHKSLLHINNTTMATSNVDFYLEKGVVHIADTRTTPTFSHYFIKHINKLEGQVQELNPRWHNVLDIQ